MKKIMTLITVFSVTPTLIAVTPTKKYVPSERYYLIGTIMEKATPKSATKNLAIIKDQLSPTKTLTLTIGESLPYNKNAKVIAITRNSVIVSDGQTEHYISHGKPELTAEPIGYDDRLIPESNDHQYQNERVADEQIPTITLDQNSPNFSSLNPNTSISSYVLKDGVYTLIRKNRDSSDYKRPKDLAHDNAIAIHQRSRESFKKETSKSNDDATGEQNDEPTSHEYLPGAGQHSLDGKIICDDDTGDCTIEQSRLSTDPTEEDLAANDF